jgi:hypothetical protein
VALAASAVLGCGSGDHAALLDEPALLVDERTPERFAGRFTAAEGAVELSSAASVQPFAGNVSIDTGSLVYAVHYDYAARRVVTDGGGRAIDRESQRLLGEGLEHVTALLGPNNPELPLHEQMLYASLAMLQESAGMPLERTTFEIEPSDVEESNVDPGGVGPGSVEKSLGNDGVSCVKRQQTYSASYDYGGTVIVDYAITADASECNGRCGPTCTQLTPWNMWTLDCLEHDACCDATSDDSCWTPLGECGDEYGEAQTDFLRGFDPFRKHCGG